MHSWDVTWDLLASDVVADLQSFREEQLDEIKKLKERTYLDSSVFRLC